MNDLETMEAFKILNPTLNERIKKYAKLFWALSAFHEPKDPKIPPYVNLDIKLDNLMMDYEGNLVFIDLGISEKMNNREI